MTRGMAPSAIWLTGWGPTPGGLGVHLPYGRPLLLHLRSIDWLIDFRPAA
jgi:hypothetical protein